MYPGKILTRSTYTNAISALQTKQAYHRRKWLELDVKVIALKHKRSKMINGRTKYKEKV